MNDNQVNADEASFPPGLFIGRADLAVSSNKWKRALGPALQVPMAWAHGLVARAWKLRHLSAVLCAEIMLTSVAYVFSTGLLSNVLGTDWVRQVLPHTLPWLTGLRLLSFMSFRSYKLSLRVPSIPEFICIIKAVTCSSLVFYAVDRFGLPNTRLPAALFILDWALSIFLLVGLHFGLRLYKTQRAIVRVQGKRALIIGAGDAGTSVVKELVLDGGSAVLPVGLIDDNPDKAGTQICGVPVLGGLQDLASFVREQKAEEVFICIPSATRSQMKFILARCRECGIPVRSLPSLAELVDGRAGLRDLRAVSIEDLLQREEVTADPAFVRSVVGNRVVLVTGAGGSIGSELCRQVAAGQPRKLLLVEKSENSLFYINLELKERFPTVRVEPWLVDVTCPERVRTIFKRRRPEVVFHAAAHKHVHLLEVHPHEAIRNNVLGTRNVAVAARDFGSARFVNISTDKAVNPRNYMGLSKKMTEILIGELAQSAQTRFMNVRFGNVAGSTGSVLRLFRDQIQKGGPLRITDPRATRYFMSIAEAVCLILHAAALGQGGETFVFDMGKALNIYEMARAFTLFSGLRPEKDLPIEFIGLKKGEKIAEELWEEREKPRLTAHNRILALSKTEKLPGGFLEEIEEFESLLERADYDGVLTRLHRIFPKFAEEHGPGSVTPENNFSRIAFDKEGASHERAAFLS
jgi:FlaA1/EpsC-like NDP-sugar epimerase